MVLWTLVGWRTGPANPDQLADWACQPMSASGVSGGQQCASGIASSSRPQATSRGQATCTLTRPQTRHWALVCEVWRAL